MGYCFYTYPLPWDSNVHENYFQQPIEQFTTSFVSNAYTKLKIIGRIPHAVFGIQDELLLYGHLL